MKTLGIITLATATLFGAAAHANDIDHWAGDDGKAPYYAPAYDGGNLRSFNSYNNGTYPGSIVIRQTPAQMPSWCIRGIVGTRTDRDGMKVQRRKRPAPAGRFCKRR